MSDVRATMQLADGVLIRERRDDELAVDVEIYNAAVPADRRITLEQVSRREQAGMDEHPLRLLALRDGTAVGAGQTGSFRFDAEGRFSLSIAVRPEHRRRGIGRALYRHLVEHAQRCGARELTTWVDERLLPIVGRWLEREHFREVGRMRTSELALDTFDAGRFAGTVDALTASGITFATLAEADTEETRRRLWELLTLTERDVPFDAPRREQSFDQFCGDLDRPDVLHDCLVIARDGDRVVGFTMTGLRTEESAGTYMTGVHPEYRGRGLALAVKARAIELTKARGFKTMRTNNHVNNPAMLAVNTKLGYTPLPEVISFVKPLV